ncbi:MAG TPA: methyl-accepting chemotaxis protein [Ktedonobacteraceae bacterium]|nr:methyl-accepting chemotaxis protein [Ktedonobacteraceae bacterium]
MLRAFSNMPIFRRLVITFAVATLIPILVILLLGNFSLQQSEIRSQAVQTSFEAQNIATQEQVNLQRMNALIQARFAQVFAQGSLSLEGDPSSGKLTEDDVQALESGFNQALNIYKTRYVIATSANMSTIRNILISDTPDHGQQIMNTQLDALNTVAQTSWPHYQSLVHKVLQDLGANTFYAVAYADFYQADLGFLELKNQWQHVVDTATQMGTTVTKVGPSLTTPLLTYTVVALIFTLLVIIAAGFLINATIIAPLNQLVGLTRRIAHGETRARATIRGRDEINLVASSINGMLDHILRLMQEAQTRHADLQAQIGQMITELSGVGEGDLRINLQATSTELSVLASSFNVMAQELNNLVVNVKILARGVQNATLQVFSYMEQLVDNSDMQIEQITSSTEEVVQVAASSRQLAERSQMLYDVAEEARQAAHRGRRAVQQTVKGMERINENVGATAQKVLMLGDRSREISSVVEVISSIAQQTNRLALDASIQAAMAGENGKGFGAVAVDIRRLAERAKEQTALIGQIVHNVLEDINASAFAMQETRRETANGTQIAQEVGKALEQMFSAVEHQAGEIEATHQVATQQMEASNRIVQVMQRVSDSAQQSSLITRNAVQQMERLARLAGQLLASVEIFKLRENQPQYSAASENGAARRPAPVRSPLRSISSPSQPLSRGISSPSQPLGRTVSSTGQSGRTNGAQPFNTSPGFDVQG